MHNDYQSISLDDDHDNTYNVCDNDGGDGEQSIDGEGRRSLSWVINSDRGI